MQSANSKTVGLIGLFDSPEPLLGAAERFRDAGVKHWDCHTPFPVHGLDRAMGLKPSPMAYVTITFAFIGFASAVALTGGLSVFQYPIRIGGKPLWSWQAFVPIFFELFVLFATVSTMVALIVMCKLGRWHSPLHDTDVMKHVTCDRFAIVLRTDDRLAAGPKVRALGGREASDETIIAQARNMLEESGCPDIRALIEFEE